MTIQSLGFPEKDVLNAALSAAIAMNLDDELDYLIKSKIKYNICCSGHALTSKSFAGMKSMPSIDFENDWKMIGIQIGSKKG